MNPIRGDWQLARTDSNCVVHGVAHCREDGQKRPLAGLLGTERPLGIVGLHDDGNHLWHLVDRGNLVIKKVGIDQMTAPAVLHLLTENLTQPHVARADYLSLHGQRVECFAAVVRCPHLQHLGLTRLHIDLDLGHVGRERVGGCNPSSRALVDTPHRWRSVGAR